MGTPRTTRPAIRALLAATLALACGALVAFSLHTSLARTAHTDAARLSQATATILEPAASDRSRPAIGHWTTTDGARHTGIVPAPPHKSAGDSHPIWIDETGQITTPPKTAIHRAAQTILAGISVTAAIIMITRPRKLDAIDTAWRQIADVWRRRYL